MAVKKPMGKMLAKPQPERHPPLELGVPGGDQGRGDKPREERPRRRERDREREVVVVKDPVVEDDDQTGDQRPREEVRQRLGVVHPPDVRLGPDPFRSFPVPILHGRGGRARSPHLDRARAVHRLYRHARARLFFNPPRRPGVLTPSEAAVTERALNDRAARYPR